MTSPITGKPRVLLTRRWTADAERYLAARYDVTLNESDVPLTAAEMTQAMRDYDAICPTVTDSLDAAILGTAGARVKIVGNFGVGYNHIDIEAARRAGITVTNTPDVLTDTTADLALLLMLMATRRAGEGERELRDGRWKSWRPTHLLGQDLSGKTLGLVGFGRIAQATARRAHHGFGMRIAYHSRRRAASDIEAQCDSRHVALLDDLVRDADVLSLHCPGGAETHHLLNRQRLGLMKKTAVLINTARGTVVDEAALVDALRSGQISSAGLDVYEREPKVEPGLLALENVVLLPHMGSATHETRTAMGMRVAANIERFFAGETVQDRVV
ncbi:MAG: D-glycerate dehydrogenase [Pseudomonadota bacterium]